MPFVTEEIYQTYFKNPKNSKKNFGATKIEETFVGDQKDKSIHISEWPKSKGGENKPDMSLDKFLEILVKIRQEKTKAKKSMNVECIVTLDKKENEEIASMLEDLKDVMNAKEIKQGKFKVEFV